ncbi:MAG: hypothetical protein ACKV19_23055 [Verrucomicrobiales bacterium]
MIMRTLGLIRKFGAVRLALTVWATLCFWIAMTLRKPWQTLALARDLPVKRIPLEDFVEAGLSIGLTISGCLAVSLIATYRHWGYSGSLPIVAGPSHASGSVAGRPWFWVAVAGLVVGTFWQARPALTHSMWGDETMMFTDNVHGRWVPAHKGGSKQGEMRFQAARWRHAFFYDRYGANHWLAAHLQRLSLAAWHRLARKPVWAFEEWVVRLVPLGAGLGAIVALAAWMREMGRPSAGLAAAAFLSLHPSHVRFCAEARGYSLMLFFLILALWAVWRALRFGRWRDWVMLALAQFLVLYSWKGALYGLVALNLVVGLRLLFGPMQDPAMRRFAVARWLVAGSLGAMLFVPLALPSELQIHKSIEETRKRAKPMDRAWRDNLITETAFGIPWHDKDVDSPRAVSMDRLAGSSPWVKGVVMTIVLAFGVGLARAWREDRFLAWVVMALLASGVAAAWHFKIVLHVELLTWYLYYLTPAFAVLFGFSVAFRQPSAAATERGMRGKGQIASVLAAGCAVAAFALLTAPMTADLRRHAREDFKQAVRMTRGVGDAQSFHRPSTTYTAWLWRHAAMYDPRGEIQIRSLESLEAISRQAREAEGQLYVVVGMRALSDAVFPEMMAVLRDSDRFEFMTTLWGGEHVNTLDIYRLRK